MNELKKYNPAEIWVNDPPYHEYKTFNDMEEDENGEWCKCEDVEKLEADNKRLREALEIYADKSNWALDNRTNCRNIFFDGMDESLDKKYNGYELAQKALTDV